MFYQYFSLFFEVQPLISAYSQIEGSLPHTAALTAPAAVWPSWISHWPAAGQQHPPPTARLITAAMMIYPCFKPISFWQIYTHKSFKIIRSLDII